MDIEARYGRRELFRRTAIAAAGAALTPIAEALSPLRASAESDEEILDLTYEEFAGLPGHSESLMNILRKSPKTLRITLNRNSRLEKTHDPIVYFGDSKEPLTRNMIMDELTRGNLVFVYAPADRNEEALDFTRGTALKFERIPVSDETALHLAKIYALPFVFKGTTYPPPSTPKPSPTPCPYFELPCYGSPVQYASFR